MILLRGPGYLYNCCCDGDYPRIASKRRERTQIAPIYIVVCRLSGLVTEMGRLSVAYTCYSSHDSFPLFEITLYFYVLMPPAHEGTTSRISRIPLHLEEQKLKRQVTPVLVFLVFFRAIVLTGMIMNHCRCKVNVNVCPCTLYLAESTLTTLIKCL